MRTRESDARRPGRSIDSGPPTPPADHHFFDHPTTGGTLVAPFGARHTRAACDGRSPPMADQTKQDNKDAQESGQPVQLDKEQQGGKQGGEQQQGGGQPMPGREQQQGGKQQEPPAK